MLPSSLELLIDELCDEFEARAEPVSNPRLSAWVSRLNERLAAAEQAGGREIPFGLKEKSRRAFVRHLILIDLWQRQRRRLTFSPVLYDDLRHDYEQLIRNTIQEASSPNDPESSADSFRAQRLPDFARLEFPELPFSSADSVGATNPAEENHPPAGNALDLPQKEAQPENSPAESTAETPAQESASGESWIKRMGLKIWGRG